MTTDTDLRDRLQSRADEQHITVSSLQDITSAGDRSMRRTRVTGSFCAIALVIVGILGFAGLGSSDKPTSMFAGLDGEYTGSPATIIATDDGWLGAVLVFDDLEFSPSVAWDDWTGEVYLASSEDGESWELADPTGLMSTSSELAMDEHDGRHWLALTEGDTMYLAFSDDLENWTRVDIANPQDFDSEAIVGRQRFVSARTLVANSAGVMAMFDSQTQLDLVYFEELFGIDAQENCSFQWSASNFGGSAQFGVRPCGETAWSHYELEDDVDLDTGRLERTLFFSPDGETFESIDLPASDQIAFPYSGNRNLYSTETGFGIADYVLSESTNGTDWTTFDLERSSSPILAAAWGELRLTSRSRQSGSFEVQTSADGQAWATHSLDEALGISAEDSAQSFSIRSIEAGEAGWAISVFLSDNTLMSNEFGQISSDVTVPVGDFELQATMPGGPADLVAEDGELIASWDNFEVANLIRNEHVRIDNDEFKIVDDEGEMLAQDSLETILHELQLSSRPSTTIVLHSPDGETWTELHRGISFVMGMAVGDDEVVIATASMQGPTSIRLPIEAD